MAFISLFTILLSIWLAYTLPKGAMNRTMWANPKNRAMTLLAIAILISIGLGLATKVYPIAVIGAIAPFLAYFVSEKKEVDRLADPDDRGSRKVYKTIVRNRD